MIHKLTENLATGLDPQNVEPAHTKVAHLVSDQPTIHFTDLPEDKDGPIAAEWNFYRREIGRLLAEGHEGRWVLIKGERIVSLLDSEKEADQLAIEKYLMQPVLIHQVLAREPVLRGPMCLEKWRR